MKPKLKAGKALSLDFETKSEADKVEEIENILKNADTGARVQWAKRVRTSMNFANGDQLTNAEIADLTSAGIPTFINDKIGPSLERLKYQIIGTSPAFRISVIDSNQDQALAKEEKIEKILQHSFEDNEFNAVTGIVVNDSLTKSLGYWYLYVDPNKSQGEGDIAITYLDPLSVIVSENSKDLLFRDASYILVTQLFSKGALCNMFPAYTDAIMKAPAPETYFAERCDQDRATTSSVNITMSDMMSMMNQGDNLEDYVRLNSFFWKKNLRYVKLALQNIPTQEDLEASKQRIEQALKLAQEEIKMMIQDQLIALKDQMDEGTISQARFQFEAGRLERVGNDEFQKAREEIAGNEARTQYRITTQVMSLAEYQALEKKFEKVLNKRVVNIKEFWKPSIMCTRVIGAKANPKVLQEVDLGVEDFPIIPLPYHFNGTVYPTSPVSRVVGKQEEVNKGHQLFIYHSTLSTSIRWLAVDGSITDPIEWDTNCTRPNARLMFNQGYEKPTPVFPGAMISNLGNAIEKAEADIEDHLGASSLPSMAADLSRMPFKGMLQLDEASTRRIRSWINIVFEPALKQVGRVYIQLAKLVYGRGYRNFTYSNPETGFKTMVEVNAPKYDSNLVAQNSSDELFDNEVNFAIVPGSTLPRSRETTYVKLRELRDSGVPIDDADMVLAADPPNRGAIIDRVSTIKRMSEQINQLNEAVKESKMTIKSLSSKLLGAGIKADLAEEKSALHGKVADAGSQLDAVVAKTRANLKSIVEIARIQSR